jgi:hypothetical protein
MLQTKTIRGRAMPGIDHAAVLQDPWLVAAISLGGGGFASQVAGVLHNDLGLIAKLVIGAGIALVIFGTIYFFAPASGG